MCGRISVLGARLVFTVFLCQSIHIVPTSNNHSHHLDASGGHPDQAAVRRGGRGGRVEAAAGRQGGGDGGQVSGLINLGLMAQPVVYSVTLTLPPSIKSAAHHQPKKVRLVKWLDFDLNTANLAGFWRENGGKGWSRVNLANLDG